MFSNTVTLALAKLSPSCPCRGTAGLTQGHTRGKSSPWQCRPAHTASFMAQRPRR